MLIMADSFNNYCLKYVDASFYQVARGLVLPTTVLLSYIFLTARPSSRVLLSCGVVSLGFFIGVFLDNYNTAQVNVPPSPASDPSSVSVFTNSLGIIFGLLSSVTTASSAVIIKQSLDFVGGSTVALAWYNNLFSSFVLFPLVFLMGEGPAVYTLLFEDEEGWATFLWGTLITVSYLIQFSGISFFMFFTGCIWLSHLHRWFLEYQGNIPHNPHGFLCGSWRCCDTFRCMVFPRSHYDVSTISYTFFILALFLLSGDVLHRFWQYLVALFIIPGSKMLNNSKIKIIVKRKRPRVVTTVYPSKI